MDDLVSNLANSNYLLDVFQQINYLYIEFMHNLIGFDSIVFYNLEQLSVHYIDDKDLVAMSKFEFPKLQSLTVLNNWIVCDENLLRSFFSKIKYIKTLKFHLAKVNPNVINIFENLVNLEFDLLLMNDIEELIGWFDMISQHQALERIKIKIRDKVLDFGIFDEIIHLRRAKPNAHFDIRINVHIYDDLVLEEYKNKFEQTKHKTNINMTIYSLSYLNAGDLAGDFTNISIINKIIIIIYIITIIIDNIPPFLFILLMIFLIILLMTFLIDN